MMVSRNLGCGAGRGGEGKRNVGAGWWAHQPEAVCSCLDGRVRMRRARRLQALLGSPSAVSPVPAASAARRTWPLGTLERSQMWNWDRYVSSVMQPSQPYSRIDHVRIDGVRLRSTIQHVSGIQLV